jgi:PAS domain S-box-containing protein
MTEKPIHDELNQRIHDNTKGKQAKRHLQENRERYQTILESIEEAYFEVDLKGDFTFFNDSLPRILGYSDEELKGMNNRDYMPSETAQEIYDLFNKIYRTGKPIREYGYEVIRKDGTIGFHELFACLMLDENGNPIGFRGIAHDVTKRKQAEMERDKLIKDLQDALAEIITLRGILPLCSFCKRIRDDKGYWEQVDIYIAKHSKADISHSVCPECAKKHYPEEYKEMFPEEEKKGSTTEHHT